MSDYNYILCLWSGGLDSTYMIQKLLDENPKNVVWASYIELKNNATKTKMELEAMNKLSKALRLKYNKSVDRFYNWGTQCSIDISVGGLLNLHQLPIWISTIPQIVTRQINQVAVGYVMNDDAISYLGDFRSIYNSFNTISNVKLPEIIFPLTKVKKEEILIKIDKQWTGNR